MDGEGVLVQAVRKGRWAVPHCPPCGQFLQGGHTIWISLLVSGCSLFLLGVAVGGCRACRGGTALSIPELPTFITGPWNVISALRTLTGNPVSCYVVSVVTGVDVGECARSAMFSLLGMAVWQGISLRNQTRETPLRKPRDYAITDLHSSQQLVMHPRMYTNPEPFGWSANHFMVSPDGQKFPLVKYVPNL